MSEKRAHTRAPLRLQLEYSPDPERDFVYEHSTNISTGGLFLETEAPLPVGTELQLRFTFPDSGERLEILGSVRWVNAVHTEGETPNPGMGIEFLSIEEGVLARVEELVRRVAILPD